MRKPSELAQVAEQIQAILDPLTESERLAVIIMVGFSIDDEEEDDDSEAEKYQEDVKDETGQYADGEQPDLRGIEKESIRRALERNKWNKHLAAQDLCISERTLYRKMREYDL